MSVFCIRGRGRGCEEPFVARRIGQPLTTGSPKRVLIAATAPFRWHSMKPMLSHAPWRRMRGKLMLCLRWSGNNPPNLVVAAVRKPSSRQRANSLSPQLFASP